MPVTSGTLGTMPGQHPWHARTCQMYPIIIKRTIGLLIIYHRAYIKFYEVEITSPKIGVIGPYLITQPDLRRRGRNY